MVGIAQEPLALLLCDAGHSRDLQQDLQIGQGHLFRCRSFAAQLQALGWQVILLELRLCDAAVPNLCWERTAAASGETRLWWEYYRPVSIQQLQQLQSLPGIEQLRNEIGREPKLLLIDSYQLPLPFYQSCSQRFPHSRLLALDDFERFKCFGKPGYSEHSEFLDCGYPQDFFVLQAVPPPVSAEFNPQYARYLRGLEYQVLRPEFGLGFAVGTDFGQPVRLPPFRLLVPGSGFSLGQVQEAVAALSSSCDGQQASGAGRIGQCASPWLVLLSPRQSAELPVESPIELPRAAGNAKIPLGEMQTLESSLLTETVIYLHNLTALELRWLYIQAAVIFCAASQSLLEVLALRPFATEWQGAEPQLCAMLSADNQLSILQTLQAAMPTAGARISWVDLRRTLRAEENLAAALIQALAKLTSRGQTAALSGPSAESLDKLGDGQAMRRILQRLDLVT